MNHEETEKRILWTKQEDQTLIHLKQDLNLQKWRQVAQKLACIHPFKNRNHQQCRDRYVNFLKNKINKNKWPIQNFTKLIKLYFQYGNKWSQIANHYQDINGLFVKNKFYSRLRKGIRNINYLIHNFLNEKWCQFKLDLTFKLINCAANKYDYSERSAIGKKIEEEITFVQDIVKDILKISWLNKKQLKKVFKSKRQTFFNQQSVGRLIEKINFIDENIQKKRSNKILPQSKSNQYFCRQFQEVKNKSAAFNIFDININNDKAFIKRMQTRQNDKSSIIQVISINSYEKDIDNLSQFNQAKFCKEKLKKSSIIDNNCEPKTLFKRCCTYKVYQPSKTLFQAQKREQVKQQELKFFHQFQKDTIQKEKAIQ